MPHIMTARAKGSARVAHSFLARAFRLPRPQMIALAGITVSIAIGASIPVESLCGLAGIGQLAWQAALAAICHCW